jgi:excisionase family DNA binding protein
LSLPECTLPLFSVKPSATSNWLRTNHLQTLSRRSFPRRFWTNPASLDKKPGSKPGKISPELAQRKPSNPTFLVGQGTWPRSQEKLSGTRNFYVTGPLSTCLKIRVTSLCSADVICAKLHISARTLGRWEECGVIPYTVIGSTHRYVERRVEARLLHYRFGPLVTAPRSTELRERVPAETILHWLGISRKTLQRRLDSAELPFYKIGQTYRFAPDEINHCLVELGGGQ